MNDDTRALMLEAERRGILPAHLKRLLITEVSDPTGKTYENIAAGAGKAVVDAGRGVRQLASKVPVLNRVDGLDPEQVQSDIDASRQRDAPLMRTGGGITGNIAGNVAMAAALPAATSLGGAAALGGAMGAVQPVSGDESRGLNTMLGVAGGAIGQRIGQSAAQRVSARLVDKTDEGAAAALRNAPRDTVLQASRAAGYVTPPSMAGGGIMLRSLEGLSNKISVAQTASKRNQEVTDALARAALRLDKDAPLDAAAIAGVKKTAGDVYEEVGQLGAINWDQSFTRGVNSLIRKKPGGVTSNPSDEGIEALVSELNSLKSVDGKSLMSDIQNLREMAKGNYAAAKAAHGNVGKTHLADAQSKAAELLEDLAERNLANNGAPADMIERFRDARKLFAKTYTVERALTEGQGVSARRLAAAQRKGAPLEGELKTAADFARTFPKAAQDAGPMGSVPKFTLTDIVMGGAGAAAHPALAALAAARPASRATALSSLVQNGLARPSYGPSSALRLADSALWNPALRGIQPGIGAAAAIPLSELIRQ